MKKKTKDFNKGVTTRMRQSKAAGEKIQELTTSDEILVFGDVALSEDEVNLLKLGPGFMVVKDLSEEDMRVECSVSLTKIRWGKMGSGREDLTGKQVEEEEKQETEDELTVARALDAEVRDVLSEDGKRLDMRKKRATDMRGNREVFMPAPGKPIVEAEYNLRSSMWQREFLRFRNENCDKSGRQKTTNLSRSQELGLRSLSRRIAKLELLVLEADKGKRFVVDDKPTYLDMANDHVAR